MRTSLHLSIVTCALAVRLVGEAPQENAAVNEIRAEHIRAHMRFLSDDLLEGRGTATRGHELAAKYIASEFEALRLEPAGTEHTYYQRVPLRRAEARPEQSSITVIRRGVEEKLTISKDYAVFGNPVKEDSTVRGDAIFVGFGVTAPELGYDDYRGVDVRGKIVVMMVGAPPRFPPAERAHYSGMPKAEQAVAHGAIGSIWLYVGEPTKYYPFSSLVEYAKAPGYRWLDTKGVPNDTFPELRGTAAIAEECARRLFEGSPKTLPEAIADGDANKPQAFPLPFEISIRMKSVHTPASSPNVMALLRGSDPALRDEYVVYTAHSDHMGIGSPVNGDAIYNGAVDNASGVAALMEIARAFARLPRPPRRSVLFVAVTGEEAGGIGSDYFAHNPTVAARSIVANINIDELPMLYDFKDIVLLGQEHSSLGKIGREAAARVDVEISPDPMPQLVRFVRSDQYSFVRQGIPALSAKAGFKTLDPSIDGKKMMLDWESKIYHTPKDDMSQPLDFSAATRCTKLDFLIGYMTAQTDERPAWNPGDFFGATFAGHPTQ